MGWFENWKLSQDLKKEKMLSEISNLKKIDKISDRIEARFAQEDPDSASWLPLGVSGGQMGGQVQSYDHYDMLDQAYHYYKHVLHARSIVRNLTKFVLGTGPKINPKDSKNKEAKKAWEKFCKTNKWTVKEKEIVKRCFRDGEVFLRWYVDASNGDTYFRFIRANRIKNPIDMDPKELENLGVSFGIECDPDDIEVPINYYLVDSEGKLKEVIPAEEITHIKLECDSDEKRGTSYLLIAMPMIKKYNSWLDDRIALNKIRSAIALIKKVDGDRNSLESIRGERASKNIDSDQHKQQSFAQGTVITATRGMSYEMLSPNIQAQDVKDDGRAMLIAISAGVGLPEMFLTADFSNANFSSSMIAQNPLILEAEDLRNFFQTALYEDAYARVIENSIEYGDVERFTKPEPTPVDKDKNGYDDSTFLPTEQYEATECIIDWSSLITADIKKNNEAYQIMLRNMCLSRTTFMKKNGLDPDVELRNMEEEAKNPVYTNTQFNFVLPKTPINQFQGGKPGGNTPPASPDSSQPPEGTGDKKGDQKFGTDVNQWI